MVLITLVGVGSIIAIHYVVGFWGHLCIAWATFSVAFRKRDGIRHWRYERSRKYSFIDSSWFRYETNFPFDLEGRK